MFTAVGGFAAGICVDGVDAGIELFKTFAMAPCLFQRLFEFIGYAGGNMSMFACCFRFC